MSKIGPNLASIFITFLFIREQLCDVKYLRACTQSTFASTVEKKCKRKQLIKKYKKTTWELSRLAVSGDGDRNCIFRTNLVPCHKLQFRSNGNANAFLRQLNDVADLVFEHCGKENQHKTLVRVSDGFVNK